MMAEDDEDLWKMSWNTIAQIRKYLNTDGEPCSTREFMEFWESLTEEEKDEFRKTKLE